MRNVSILLLVLLLAPSTARSESEFPQIKGRAAKVEYYRFALLRRGDHIVAVHILPDPRYGRDAIVYRWYALRHGSDRFFQRDWLHNSNVSTGSGEAREGSPASERLAVGPLVFEWSQGSDKVGWLYLGDESIEIYPVQFDRFDEFSGKLDPAAWVQLEKRR